MSKRGPTLYKPPSYLKRRMKQFAYTVRDKVNSFHGYERIKLIDFRGLEDGDILIAMMDATKPDDAMFIKWNSEKTSADECVRSIINGLVEDMTEAFEKVEETIKMEDR